MNPSRIFQNYDVEATVTDKLHRVGRLFRARANAFFRAKGVDLTVEQWGILVRLSEKEGRPQGTLASRVFLDYPNITRRVDTLEKRGLVRRTPDPGDRRSHLLYLTQKGKKLVEDLLPDVIEAKGKYYKGLNERDIQRLSDILAVIENNLVQG